MIKVTWEWLGQGPALDLADTVTIEDGAERDLISTPQEYKRWAEIEAEFLPASLGDVLMKSRAPLMELRTTVRDVASAIAAGAPPPRSTVSQLNRLSRSVPQWIELDPITLELHTTTSGRSLDRLLAWYARSALEIVAEERERLKRCPAPSCGMFYLRSRPQQRWCSTQCGSRARVASYYRKHRV